MCQALGYCRKRLIWFPSSLWSLPSGREGDSKHIGHWKLYAAVLVLRQGRSSRCCERTRGREMCGLCLESELRFLTGDLALWGMFVFVQRHFGCHSRWFGRGGAEHSAMQNTPSPQESMTWSKVSHVPLRNLGLGKLPRGSDTRNQTWRGNRCLVGAGRGEAWCWRTGVRRDSTGEIERGWQHP